MIEPIILTNWRHPDTGVTVAAAFVFFGEINLSVNQKIANIRVDVWPSLADFAAASEDKQGRGKIDCAGAFWTKSFDVKDTPEDPVFTNAMNRLCDPEDPITFDEMILELAQDYSIMRRRSDGKDYFVLTGEPVAPETNEEPGE